MSRHFRASEAVQPADEALAHIDQLLVFSAWPSALKKRLAAASRIVNLAKGRKVLTYGDDCADLIVVLSGNLVSYRDSQDGKQSVMFYWHRHDLLGLAPIFGGGPFSFNLHAQSRASLLFIPAQKVLEAVGENPRLLGGLFEVICHRYRLTIEMFCRQTLMPLRERMIDRLAFLAETQGQAAEGGGVTLGIRLSQEDLAAMLSATRQSVNKELRWLVEEGAITLAYNTITITDLAYLRGLVAPHAMLPILPQNRLSSPLSMALTGKPVG